MLLFLKFVNTIKTSVTSQDELQLPLASASMKSAGSGNIAHKIFAHILIVNYQLDAILHEIPTFTRTCQTVIPDFLSLKKTPI